MVSGPGLAFAKAMAFRSDPGPESSVLLTTHDASLHPQVIEDVVSLYDVAVSIRGTASKVSLAPSGEELPFENVDGRVEFRVPELELHQMVVLDD